MANKSSPTSRLVPPEQPAEAPRTIEEMSSEGIKCLPVEIMMKIFCELDIPSAAMASLVCRDWSNLLQDNLIWRSFFRRDFKPRENSPEIGDFRKAYIDRRTLHSNLNMGVYVQQRIYSPEDVSYKRVSQVCADGKLITLSEKDRVHRGKAAEIWDIGTGKLLHKLQLDNDEWVTCLIVADGKIITGSLLGTVKIWDIATGVCSGMHGGHHNTGDGAVIQLAHVDDKLVSVHFNGQIKIWNIATDTCEATFADAVSFDRSTIQRDDINFPSILMRDPNKQICTFYCADGKLISCDCKNVIKIWDLESGSCLRTIDEHASVNVREAASVIIECFNGKLVISGDHGKIAVWNLATGSCLRRFSSDPDEVDNDEVVRLCNADGKLISALADQLMIRVFDVDAGACLHSLSADEDMDDYESVAYIAYADGKLIAGYADCLSRNNMVRIWDINTGDCVCKLTGHNGCFARLVHADGKLFSSSADGMIRIWDMDTGACLHEHLRDHNGCAVLGYTDGVLTLTDAENTTVTWNFNLKQDPAMNTKARAENSVDALLAAVENGGILMVRMPEILAELKSVDPSLMDKFYDLLWRECCPQPESGAFLTSGEIREAIDELSLDMSLDLPDDGKSIGAPESFDSFLPLEDILGRLSADRVFQDMSNGENSLEDHPGPIYGTGYYWHPRTEREGRNVTLANAIQALRKLKEAIKNDYPNLS